MTRTPTPSRVASRRAFAVVTAGTAAGLLLASCGGGGGGGPVAPPTAPALDIRSDVVGEARAPFTVTFYFAGNVVLPGGVLALTVSGGSVVAGSFRRVDDRTYAVQIRPNTNAQGLIDLRVPAGAFLDATGSAASTVAYAFAQPYDTLPPLATLTFGGPVDALGFITGAGTFTLRFSGALDAPLNGALLRLSSGAVSAFTRVSAAQQPDVYTFTFTPPSATFGALLIELPADSVTRNGIGNDTDYWTFGLATR